jgi:PKD repeat protein
MFASLSPIDSRSDLHPQWGCPVPPDADARSSVTSGIAPLDVVFTAAFSSDLNGDALTYEWNLGDGTNSSETVVNKTYPAGDYTVSLVVSDGELLDTSYVSIQSINVAPAVSVTTSDLEGLSPLTVSFDASGTTDQNGDALTFLWDFANGDTSPEPIVERVFKAGQYEVLLTVSDGIVTDSTWFSILSVNEAPQVALQTSATSGQAPFEITFDASGTRDANSDSLSFAWDLGDGSTSSDTIVVHTYTAAGDYNVVLTVSDGIESVSDSLTVSIASGVATEAAELPESYELRAAYPNPFNPTTTISYALPAPSEVRISVVDMLGRQVATLVSGDMKAAGYHTVQFNADGLASGTYLIRMEAGDFVATQQVVLLK